MGRKPRGKKELRAPRIPGNLLCRLRALVSPVSQHEDGRRREAILTILLLAASALTAIAILGALWDVVRQGSGYHGTPPVLLLIPLGFFLGLFAMVRYGWLTLAAHIFVGLFYVFGLYTVSLWGFFIPQGLLVYALVIVMAGILINNWATYLYTGLTGTSLVLLAYLQTHHVLSPDLAWTRTTGGINDSVIFAVTLGIIATVSWISNRELERSLHLARASEAALMEERALLETRVEERTRELQKAQEEKITQLYRFAEFGKLSSGILHSLATPLSVVSLNLEQLQDKEQSTFLERALLGAQQMEESLKAARHQVQTFQEKRYVDVVEEVTIATRAVAAKAQESHTNLRIVVEDTFHVLVSSSRFNQLLLNLLINAVEACAVTDHISNTITVRVASTPTEGLIEIGDTGCGIAPENLGKLFTPFFTTKGSEGTGIGLANSHEIACKDLHGSIDVSSEIGKGSVFTIRIPLHHATEADH